MRLGGPIFIPHHTPDEWAQAVRDSHYRAAFCPVSSDVSDDVVTAYINAAKRADIVIAEVGAWSNPISRDDLERRKAVDYCQKQLHLADRMGAVCCVNIAGSRGSKWDGPDPANLSAETFDLIVQTVREIIDAVKPGRTVYSLESMPWTPPDSPDSYLELIKAIDRKTFAVHLDPVNMINCPGRAYDTAGFLRECFAKLGPHVRSCHAKDIKLGQNLTLHLDECRPGTGVLDYRVFLSELAKLPPDIPLMLEHLPNEEEYRAAGDYVRGVAEALGLGRV